MGDGEYASTDRQIIGTVSKFIKDYANDVLTVLVLSRDGDRLLAWFREEPGSIVTVRISEETRDYDRASGFLRRQAADKHIEPAPLLFADLQLGSAYTAAQLNGMFDRWFNAGLREIVSPEYARLADCRCEAVKESSKECALEEPEGMIGLGGAKTVIRRSLDYFKAQKLFADKGLAADRPVMSMVFTGNPGTARTSVARLVARILTENGILTEGHMVEVDAATSWDGLSAGRRASSSSSGRVYRVPRLDTGGPAWYNGSGICTTGGYDS